MYPQSHPERDRRLGVHLAKCKMHIPYQWLAVRFEKQDRTVSFPNNFETEILLNIILIRQMFVIWIRYEIRKKPQSFIWQGFSLQRFDEKSEISGAWEKNHLGKQTRTLKEISEKIWTTVTWQKWNGLMEEIGIVKIEKTWDFKLPPTLTGNR